ncbi:NAD(P)/FAD-dependent oxidoreductase [Polaromonas sp.]|uniref:NAD(P)/FAD-dependent oxidoreductase n=1 Tax=Polaromonas sp. TaxID=1869339 RepID=UPI003BAA2656
MQTIKRKLTMLYDAIIVGGSFAGLSAALQIARARRNVLVIDAGSPRNRFASHAHGMLAQDGKPGTEILATAAKQLLAYPTAQIFKCKATAVARKGNDFVVEVEDGARWFTSRRLLLATGVADNLPDVPGLQERWGSTVLHCPYCHGYELGGGPIGVLGVSAMSVHQALVVADWGDVTLFAGKAVSIDEEQRAMLARRKVKVEPVAVAALEGDALAIDVGLVDGRRIALRAVFVGGGVRPVSPFAQMLGCAMDETPMGQTVQTDALKQTTVPGVYAAGDAAGMRHSISLAAGDGALAGTMLHQSLVAEDARG